MIGNVIQSKFLVIHDYPARGGAVVHPDGVHPDRDLPLRARARRAQPHRGGDLDAATRDADRGSLGVWSALALLYLFIPIFIVVLFSFNDPQGRFNFTWQGFTLDHWLHPFANPDLGDGAAELAA